MWYDESEMNLKNNFLKLFNKNNNDDQYQFEVA